MILAPYFLSLCSLKLKGFLPANYCKDLCSVPISETSRSSKVARPIPTVFPANDNISPSQVTVPLETRVVLFGKFGIPSNMSQALLMFPYIS